MTTKIVPLKYYTERQILSGNGDGFFCSQYVDDHSEAMDIRKQQVFYWNSTLYPFAMTRFFYNAVSSTSHLEHIPHSYLDKIPVRSFLIGRSSNALPPFPIPWLK